MAGKFKMVTSMPRLGSEQGSAQSALATYTEDAVESRVQKAARELVAKDQARTAVREAEAAKIAEANRTVEIAHDTYDFNRGKDDIVVTTNLMTVNAHTGELVSGGPEGAFQQAEAQKAIATVKNGHEGEKEDGSDDDDDFFDDHDAIEAFRAKRLAAMKAKKARRNKNRAFGEYREIAEPEFLKTVTKNKHVVVHFFHREFKRCAIMDKRLGMVAYKHDEIKFVKINAEKTPFFVKKLCIRILPSVIFFTDGVAKDRITGFEDLGADDFRTRSLEFRLLSSGMLQDPSPPGSYPDDNKDDDSDSD